MPHKWTREEALAKGALGRATIQRRAEARKLDEALERDIRSGGDLDLASIIKVLQRQLSRSAGTIRGTRLTEQIRNLVHAQRLMKTLPRGHAQEPETPKPLPNPIE